MPWRRLQPDGEAVEMHVQAEVPRGILQAQELAARNESRAARGQGAGGAPQLVVQGHPFL